MKLVKLLLVFLVVLLTACGGGGGGGSQTPSSLSISGVAATGAAISGGTIEAICQAGLGSATSNADGTYTLSVSGGQQPCLLRATDPVTQLTLHSMIETGATTANITPVTDLVVANTLGADPATAFGTFTSTMQQKVTAGNISNAVTKVQAATAALGTDADMTGIDPMKANIRAATTDSAGDATDKKIDALMAALAAADKKVADLSALLKTSSSPADAVTQLTTLVGDAKNSLPNCPAARNGNVWVLDFFGSAPIAYNINFTTLKLKNLDANTTTDIVQNSTLPCAFTSIVNTRNVEFRVSDSGISAWKNGLNFGLAVPKQISTKLDSSAYSGTYDALAFLINKQTGFNAAAPFKFEIDSAGKITGYSCDLTKTTPDCITALSTTNDSKTTCTALSNGTLSCMSSDGKLNATAIGFVSGGSATLFMSITDSKINTTTSAGGLIVMTKAPALKLPTVGSETAAGAWWSAGITSNNQFISIDSIGGKVESVDTSKNSIVKSFSGTTVTHTAYLNTPTKGMVLSKASSGATAISIGSPAGWYLEIIKSTSTSTIYDAWFVGIRNKRS
jgi:hypothetical protein